MPAEIGLRWYVLFLMIIFSVYFLSPGLYSHINALSHKIIYSEDVRLNEIQSSKKHDNRSIKVDVKIINREFVFEGSADEVKKSLNRNLNMTIYDGLFFEYALIEK